MAIKKMEHVGIVVDDLEGAIEFFVELGLDVLPTDVVNTADRRPVSE